MYRQGPSCFCLCLWYSAVVSLPVKGLSRAFADQHDLGQPFSLWQLLAVLRRELLLRMVPVCVLYSCAALSAWMGPSYNTTLHGARMCTAGVIFMTVEA